MVLNNVRGMRILQGKRCNGRRTISPIERADCIVWLNQFHPETKEEKRAKVILQYFLLANMSASSIARLKDPDIVSFGNRSKGCYLTTGGILRIIYSYFPQFKNRKAKNDSKRLDLMNKRRKTKNPHIKRCAFCGSEECLEEHHMIPLFLGGTNDDNNLIYLCGMCHKEVTQYQRTIKRR